jgi:hypothetical protein
VRVRRICRLLIGMHRPDEELIRALYSTKRTLTDADYVIRCKRQIASDFKNNSCSASPPPRMSKPCNTSPANSRKAVSA